MHDLNTEFYRCKFLGCSYKTGQRSNLNHHAASHNTERPFKCGSCSSAFKLKHALQRHEKGDCGARQAWVSSTNSRYTGIGDCDQNTQKNIPTPDPSLADSPQLASNNESPSTYSLSEDGPFQAVGITQDSLDAASPGTDYGQTAQQSSITKPYTFASHQTCSNSPQCSPSRTQVHTIALTLPSGHPSVVQFVDDLRMTEFLNQNPDLFDSARYR